MTAAETFARNRTTVIASGVALFHVAALWALQTGLLMRAVEVIVPVAMITEFITPPEPKPEPLQAPKPEQLPQPVVKKTAPTPPPAPQPLAIADAPPTANAPTGIVAPPQALPPIAAPVAVAPAPPPAPHVELPSTNADYLNNPRPAYPKLSKQRMETGTVIHNVQISAQGTPLSARLVKSSGFPRLDEAAYDAVMKWRYVPGKRNGVPETMSYDVPINWVLDK